MRNGQNNNKRMRGRNRGKGGGSHHHQHHQNPLSRMYESSGPDVKIRGNASHIAEKYLQLARDAQSSGDPIAAENYYQHAEHYFRLIAAAQENLRQNQPSYYQQPGQPGGANGSDDSFDDDGDDQPGMSGEPYAPAPQQQPFYPQQQPQQNFQPQQPQQQNFQPRPQQNFQQNDDDNVDRLPSFITGGQAPQQPPQQYAPQGQNSNGQASNSQASNNQASNGQNGNGNGYEGQADRFPLHRRRRRHRGPRDQAMQGDAPGDQGAVEE
jgi:hypothetical protein